MARTCKQQGCKNAVLVGWQGTLSAECAVSTAAHPGRPGTAARSGCGTEGLCPAQHPAGPGTLLLWDMVSRDCDTSQPAACLFWG